LNYHHGSIGNADVWVFKLDVSGAIEWQKSFGGTLIDEGRWVGLCNDSGYLIGGFTSSTDGDVTNPHGLTDYWLIRTDSSGTIQWQKTLGGNGIDECYVAEITNDGGIIASGKASSNDDDVSSNHGNYDFWVVKLADDAGIGEKTFNHFSCSISPNPARASFSLRMNKGLNKARLKIYNTLGYLIKDQNIDGQSAVIKCDALEKGIYFIRVSADGGECVGKVVVE
jgi:hypothetical protein